VWRWQRMRLRGNAADASVQPPEGALGLKSLWGQSGGRRRQGALPFGKQNPRTRMSTICGLPQAEGTWGRARGSPSCFPRLGG
jgi:hypothetical protein